MKIAYIGHFLDGGGYSTAAIDYIESLEKAGLEVVAIPFCLSKKTIKMSTCIEKSYNRKMDGVDIVILHTLPEFFSPHPTLPTIGIFSTEMSGIPKKWVEEINKLPYSIVSSEQSKDACYSSGVLTKIDKVPYCVDIKKYSEKYDCPDVIDEIKAEGKSVFYTVGEFVNRKNYSSLLRAYYTEFTNKDKVHLVIKSGLNGKNPQELAQIFQMKNREIFKGLNLPPENMPEVTFLPSYMNEEEILGLHQHCDFYVCASYGESWSLPSFDGMAFGKTPIVPSSTGFLEYMSDDEGFMVKTLEAPCFGLIDANPEIYNSHFNYFQVDINDLRNKMRFCLSNKDSMEKKSIAGIEKAKLFSHEVIGPKLRKAIENVTKELQ